MNVLAEIKMYEILQTQFTKEQSQDLVEEMKNIQEVGLMDKIELTVSQAESRIVSSIIWKVLAISGGQLIILLAILKMFVL